MTKFVGYRSLSKFTKLKLLAILLLVVLGDILAFKYYLISQKKIDNTTKSSIQISEATNTNSIVDKENHNENVPKLGPSLPVPNHTKTNLDKSNTAPVISKIDTDQKVVFLTIDDGGTKHADMLGLLQSNNIKASLFLTNNFIADNYDFFKPFKKSGMNIQNHTLSHQYARPGALSYETQKNEICGMADKIEQVYGTRPTLFRPPGGWVDDNTKLATKECGMKAVVLWIAKANGGSMQYQVGNSLRPGDIVLMHFRPEFADDLAAFVRARDEAGLTTDYLENWI